MYAYKACHVGENLYSLHAAASGLGNHAHNGYFSYWWLRGNGETSESQHIVCTTGSIFRGGGVLCLEAAKYCDEESRSIRYIGFSRRGPLFALSSVIGTVHKHGHFMRSTDSLLPIAAEGVVGSPTTIVRTLNFAATVPSTEVISTES